MHRAWLSRVLAPLPVLLTACVALSPVACSSSGGDDSEDDGTETGDGDGDGDVSCAVAYTWNPGAGDVTSFPTWEMSVDDPGTATGKRVDVSVESFAGFEVYDRWAEPITRDLSTLDGFSVLGEAFLGFDGALAETLAGEADAAAVTDAAGMVVYGAGGAATQVPVAVELWDDGTTLAVRPMKTLPPNVKVAVYLRGDGAAAVKFQGIKMLPQETAAAARKRLALGVMLDPDEDAY